jgi:hypothetical protein
VTEMDVPGTSQEEAASNHRRALPPDALIIIPVRNIVLFPGMLCRLQSAAMAR